MPSGLRWHARYCRYAPDVEPAEAKPPSRCSRCWAALGSSRLPARSRTTRPARGTCQQPRRHFA